MKTETFESKVHLGVKVTVKVVTTALRIKMDLASIETIARQQELGIEFKIVAPDAKEGQIPEGSADIDRKVRRLSTEYDALERQRGLEMTRECLVEVVGYPDAPKCPPAEFFDHVDDAPFLAEIVAALNNTSKLTAAQVKNSPAPITSSEAVAGATPDTSVETVSVKGST